MLDPRSVPATPWRNGLGATRELAHETGADGRTDWRISVASLERDAAFSAFPGLDRVLVALGPLSLDVAGDVTRLAAGEQLAFGGETPVSVALDAPTSALNVMTRRGAVNADVSLRDAERPPAAGTTASVDLASIHPAGVVADVRITRAEEQR